jgi:hypothetical protein
MMTQVTNEKVIPQRPPGYLMAPFDWAAKPLAAMLEADPSLYPALFTLSRRRMHLIALALAHWRGEIDAQLAGLLIGGAPDAVLGATLGRGPAGLERALKRLPVGVLPQASYLHLVELLEEPATAKLIYHVGLLNDDYIGLLHSIPPPLRRIAARLIADVRMPHPEGLADGLRILAARGAAPSFEALVADLATIRQPAQFLARLGKLVQRLPLPELMPPATVAGARRLDDIAEICRLSKRWRNCLADCYLNAVNDGRSAIYLWSHADAPAVCAVSRHGRLGWALQDAEGPENADLPPARLEEICYAFAAAGIPGEAAIEALEHVASAQSLRRHGIRHRRLHRRDEDAEIAEVYEELEALQAT